MKNLSIRQIKCLITLILAVFLCGAPAVAQTQKIAVKLDMTKVPMKTVMNEIEKQTKYLFLLYGRNRHETHRLDQGRFEASQRGAAAAVQGHGHHL